MPDYAGSKELFDKAMNAMEYAENTASYERAEYHVNEALAWLQLAKFARKAEQNGD